jgi:replicative DNA helicase
VQSIKEKIRFNTYLAYVTNVAMEKSNSVTYAMDMNPLLRTFHKNVDALASKYANTDSVTSLTQLTGANDAMFIGHYLIDELLGGLETTNVHLVASQQGQGKTQEAVQIALDACLKAGKKVLFISPEVKSIQVLSRIASCLLREYNFETYNKSGYTKDTLELMNKVLKVSGVSKTITDNLIIVDNEMLPTKLTDSFQKDNGVLFDAGP